MLFLTTAGIVGLVVGWCVTWRMSRAVRTAQEETARIRLQLAACLQLVGEDVVFCDMDGQLVLANIAPGRSACAGVLTELPGTSDGSVALLDSDDAVVPPERWPLARVLRGESFKNWELTVRRIDGTGSRVVRYSGAPVVDERGTPIMSVIVTRDVSAEAHAEVLLSQDQKMQALGLLTSGVAHDFNNVLTVILGNAGLIKQAMPSDWPLHVDLAEVLGAARRGAMMTTRLLGFASRGQSEMTIVHPGSVVTGLGPILRRLLPSRVNLEVVDATSEVHRVYADVPSLELAIVSLFASARAAVPYGGLLRIHCEPVSPETADEARLGSESPQFVSIGVDNTGRLAELEGSGNHPQNPGQLAASGRLDFSMAREVARQHHGVLDVDIVPGGGTAVALRLPVATAAAAPIARVWGPVGQVRTGTETILLADNDASIRRITQRVLESHGYQVLAAGNGAEALEVYRRNKTEIRLLLLDLVMPQMGGMDVAATVRGEGHLLPTVFVTGASSGTQVSVESLPAGTVLLSKPWVAEELLGVVRQLLDTATSSR